jgi:large subunit ribosomal protein L18e
MIMLQVESALEAVKAAAKSSGKPVYRRALKVLSKPVNSLPELNVGKLDAVAPDGSAVLVPGKVLGEGAVTKKLSVGAVSFTRSAAAKIAGAGGEALLLKDFVVKHGDGKGVLLIGG